MHARLRCKVSSDREELELLNSKHFWTPGRAATRPSQESIREKAQLMENAMLRYDNVGSYVLHRVFHLPASARGGFASNVMFVSEETLKSARRTREERESGKKARLTVFNDNLFPYQLPEQTRHSVLWLLLDEDESDENNFISDAEITDLLEKELASPEIQYIWYRNPKPSVLDNVTYHVQVFWTKSN